jgi:hypothetical protein
MHYGREEYALEEARWLVQARVARAPRQIFEPAEHDDTDAVRSMLASLHALMDVERRVRAEGRAWAPHAREHAELRAFVRVCSWVALSAPPPAVCLRLMDLNATAGGSGV